MPGAFAVALPGGPPGRGPNALKSMPNSIINGTGPWAFMGVVSVSRISTWICGHFTLSTCPTSRRVMAGVSPIFSSDLLVTSQVTPGTSFGTRP